jgi:hypothetical protein
MTYYMEQGTSCDDNSHSAGQETPLVLWNVNFLYHIERVPH